nr:CCR4-NOT transcription complex subunit 3 [Ipomoea batatas]
MRVLTMNFFGAFGNKVSLLTRAGMDARKDPKERAKSETRDGLNNGVGPVYLPLGWGGKIKIDVLRRTGIDVKKGEQGPETGRSRGNASGGCLDTVARAPPPKSFLWLVPPLFAPTNVPKGTKDRNLGVSPIGNLPPHFLKFNSQSSSVSPQHGLGVAQAAGVNSVPSSASLQQHTGVIHQPSNQQNLTSTASRDSGNVR